jgi:hypothetical protein
MALGTSRLSPGFPVTLPHLHSAVRLQSAYLDPAKVLWMNLSAVH